MVLKSSNKSEITRKNQMIRSMMYRKATTRNNSASNRSKNAKTYSKQQSDTADNNLDIKKTCEVKGDKSRKLIECGKRSVDKSLQMVRKRESDSKTELADKNGSQTRKRGRPLGSKNSKTTDLSDKKCRIRQQVRKVKKVNSNGVSKYKAFRFQKRGRPSLKDKRNIVIDMRKYRRELALHNSIRNLFEKVCSEFEAKEKGIAKHEEWRETNCFLKMAKETNLYHELPEILFIAPLFDHMTIEWMQNVNLAILYDRKPSYEQIVAKLRQGSKEDMSLLNKEEFSMRLIRNMADRMESSDDEFEHDYTDETIRDSSSEAAGRRSHKLFSDLSVQDAENQLDMDLIELGQNELQKEDSNYILERACSPPRIKNESRQSFAPDLKALAQFLANSEYKSEAFRNIRPPFSMSTIVYMAIVKLMSDASQYESQIFNISNANRGNKTKLSNLNHDTGAAGGVTVEAICKWIGDKFEFYRINSTFENDEAMVPKFGQSGRFDDRSRKIIDTIVQTLNSNKCFQKVSKIKCNAASGESRRNLWKLDPTYSTISMFKQFYDCDEECIDQTLLKTFRSLNQVKFGHNNDENSLDYPNNDCIEHLLNRNITKKPQNLLQRGNCFESLEDKENLNSEPKRRTIRNGKVKYLNESNDYIGDDYMTGFVLGSENEREDRNFANCLDKSAAGLDEEEFRFDKTNELNYVNAESGEFGGRDYVSIFDALSEYCDLDKPQFLSKESPDISAFENNFGNIKENYDEEEDIYEALRNDHSIFL